MQSNSVITRSNQNEFQVMHTYALAGIYNATITVEDKDGGIGIDGAGNTVTIVYNKSGILQPINLTTPRSSFKIGSTIPVKIRVTNCDGASIGGLSIQVNLQKLDSYADPTNEIIEVSVPDVGNTMRYDSGGQQYIYNLSTKRSQMCPTNPSICTTAGDLTAGTYRITLTSTNLLFGLPATATFDAKS